MIQAIDGSPSQPENTASPSGPARDLPIALRLWFPAREVLALKVRDVDLQQGVITVKQGKFGKDRLVPPAKEMVQRLRRYAEALTSLTLPKRTAESYFFPSASDSSWHSSGIAPQYIGASVTADIPHRGRGKGPGS